MENLSFRCQEHQLHVLIRDSLATRTRLIVGSMRAGGTRTFTAFSIDRVADEVAFEFFLNLFCRERHGSHCVTSASHEAGQFAECAEAHDWLVVC